MANINNNNEGPHVTWDWEEEQQRRFPSQLSNPQRHISPSNSQIQTLPNLHPSPPTENSDQYNIPTYTRTYTPIQTRQRVLSRNEINNIEECINEKLKETPIYTKLEKIKIKIENLKTSLSNNTTKKLSLEISLDNQKNILRDECIEEQRYKNLNITNTSSTPRTPKSRTLRRPRSRTSTSTKKRRRSSSNSNTNYSSNSSNSTSTSTSNNNPVKQTVKNVKWLGEIGGLETIKWTPINPNRNRLPTHTSTEKQPRLT